jgi:DNA-binding MarR family transcriptional regulator
VPRRPRSQLLAELYARPGFLLRRAHQVNAAIFDDECRDWEITHTQYGLLMAIASTDDVDVVGAARLTGSDRTTAHLAVRNLERAGLISRRRDPGDARRHLLSVTPAGLELLRRTKPALRRVKDRLLANLTPKEAETLLGLLRRITRDPT